MNINNKISAVMTEEQLANVAAATVTIATNMPFRQAMSAALKRKYPTIGPERAGMVPIFFAAMVNHPEFLPGYLSMAEVTKDRDLWTQLLTPQIQVRNEATLIDDTRHALGSDLLMAFYGYYNNAKEAALRNIPGAQEIVDMLAPWFERSAEEEEPPAPEA